MFLIGNSIRQITRKTKNKTADVQRDALQILWIRRWRSWG